MYNKDSSIRSFAHSCFKYALVYQTVGELEDSFENLGASIIKEVCVKTNDVAGDGTTTASVLAQAIIREGNKNFTAGANPIILRQGIENQSCPQGDNLGQ